MIQWTHLAINSLLLQTIAGHSTLNASNVFGTGVLCPYQLIKSYKVVNFPLICPDIYTHIYIYIYI